MILSALWFGVQFDSGRSITRQDATPYFCAPSHRMSTPAYLKDVSLEVMDELGQEGQGALGQYFLSDGWVEPATVRVVLHLLVRWEEWGEGRVRACDDQPKS